MTEDDLIDQFAKQKTIKNFIDVNYVSLIDVSDEEIGSFYAKKMNLPKSIINVIRHHHYVDSSMDDKQNIAIVMVANNLAKGMKFGKSDNFYLEPIPDWVWRYLQLDQTMYYQIISDIQDKFDIATAFIK